MVRSMIDTAAPRVLHVLLPTIGSAGDVHPIVALALALKARGHRATVITNPIFQELIEGEGLGFLPIGTIEQARFGIPLATVHLQPSIIRSLVDAGMAGTVRISASQPMWFKRAFFRLADWLLIDRELRRPLN